MNTPWIHRQRAHWRALSPTRRRLLGTLVVVIGVLVLARAALPLVLRHFINERLARLEPYHGHVGEVDLALWRGAYGISAVTLTIHHDGAPEPETVLTIERLDIALQWGALLRGQLLGNLIITRPEVFLTPRLLRHGAEPPPPVATVTTDGTRPPAPKDEEARQWQDHLRQLSLLHFDTILVHQGVLSYRDDERAVEEIRLATLAGRLDGLALGSQADGQEARLTITGETIGDGTVSVQGVANPLAAQPTFSVRAAVESLACPALNPLTERFDHLTFDAGTFSCFIELDAADGRIDGFLKPIFIDLSVASFKDDSGSAASRLFWSTLVPVAEFVLENREEDQHAARIPISGAIDAPDTDVWVLVTSSLRNAFIQAIIPGFASEP